MPSQQQCMAHQQAHGCQSCDSLRQRALIPCLVRPLVDVEAVAIGDGVYKIVSIVQEGEEWEFQPGDIVRRESHDFSNASGLVAVAVVDA